MRVPNLERSMMKILSKTSIFINIILAVLYLKINECYSSTFIEDWQLNNTPLNYQNNFFYIDKIMVNGYKINDSYCYSCLENRLVCYDSEIIMTSIDTFKLFQLIDNYVLKYVDENSEIIRVILRPSENKLKDLTNPIRSFVFEISPFYTFHAIYLIKNNEDSMRCIYLKQTDKLFKVNNDISLRYLNFEIKDTFLLNPTSDATYGEVMKKLQKGIKLDTSDYNQYYNIERHYLKYGFYFSRSTVSGRYQSTYDIFLFVKEMMGKPLLKDMEIDRCFNGDFDLFLSYWSSILSKHYVYSYFWSYNKKSSIWTYDQCRESERRIANFLNLLQFIGIIEKKYFFYDN